MGADTSAFNPASLSETERLELENSIGKGMCPELPRAVWEQRIARCRELMERDGFDAVLVYAGGQNLTGREWARYFANYKEPLWNSEAFIFIPLKDEITFIMNYTHLIEPVRKSSPVSDIRAYEYFGSASRYDEFGKILKDLLREKKLEKAGIGLGRCGMQGDFFPSLLDRTIAETAPEARLGDASKMLSDLICVKTEYDIGMIRKSNELLGRGTKALFDAVGDGRKEHECYAAFWEAVCDGGAEVEEMAGCHVDMQSAPGAEMRNKPFSVTLRRMKKGDMVTIDPGVTYRGYVSDIARTAVIGKPNDEQKRIFDATLEGLFAMRDALTAGVRCSELCEKNFQVIRKHGFDVDQAHCLQGHGIGFMKNERPILQPWNHYRIKKGEVLSLETQLMIPNVARVYMEDTYLVTEGKPERLSTPPQELFIR